MQIYKKPAFPSLICAGETFSEVLSDDVTAIVEVKECEETGFSSSKHRFSKPASIYGRKENGGLVILTRVVFST